MLEGFSYLGMENTGGSCYVPDPHLTGTLHNLPNTSSSPSFKLFSPLNIHKQSYPSIINVVEEHNANVLNPDCKGLDNALACLDDYLMGEDTVEYNEMDTVVPQDPLTIFSFPYNINYFANAPASSFRLGQFNALMDETGALLSTATAEHPKAVPVSEPDCLTDVDELLLNATQNVGCLPTHDEFVPYLADSALADWHASKELRSPWPFVVYQRPGQCEQCEILRQIVHTNGLQGTKLEIHGREGQNYHAVMQTRFWLNDGCPPTVEQQMVEFPVGNSDYVKQFLLQYSLLRKKEGFLLQQDSLTPNANAGYQMTSADCTMAGFNCCVKEEDSASVRERLSILAEHNYIAGDDDNAVKYNTSVSPAKLMRGSAAAQRERTGKLKMSDLAKHFHLPINAAAKELGICPTVLKKICRRNGMRRWPHRKIKSIERIIATLEQTIAEGAGQGDEEIRKEIAMLRNERTQLCAGLMGQP